jgi:hypothetical protein
MKLAALGVVTVGLGVALTIPGLIGIGLFWVLMGLLARTHARRVKEVQAEGKERSAALGEATDRTPAAVDGRTFTRGTLLMLSVGLPSLAVGLFEIGIDPQDADWRWLPIAVGGLTSGIAVLGGIMYAAGVGVTAAAGGEPEHPATLWIRSVTETGTFINERPRMEFVFQVEPDASTGLAAYEVTKRATVPFTAMAALRVGDGFKALVVGPDRPTNMTIDWDAPVRGAVPAAAPASSETAPSLDSDSPDVASRLEALEQLRRDAKITDEEYQAQRERILGSL